MGIIALLDKLTVRPEIASKTRSMHLKQPKLLSPPCKKIRVSDSYPDRHSLRYMVRVRERGTLPTRNRICEGTILDTQFDIGTIKI